MRDLDAGIVEEGRSADFVLLDRAQHAPGKTILESIEGGNLPGVGMTIIDGLVCAPTAAATRPRRRLCRRWWRGEVLGEYSIALRRPPWMCKWANHLVIGLEEFFVHGGK